MNASDIAVYRKVLQDHSPSVSEDGWDQVCEDCDTDWPCPAWDNTFSPETIRRLLDAASPVAPQEETK